jgi:hypothetical protein
MPLMRFPGVLCDLRGFVLYREKEEFDNAYGYFYNPRGKRIHVAGVGGTISDFDGHERYETNAKQRGMSQSDIDRAKAEMLDC